MKKRLRKKKHIGEYKVFGVPFHIKRSTKNDFDSFLDAFLEEAVEANGCCCGGGGKDEELSGFIELDWKDNKPDVALEKIINWIKNRSDIDKYIFGEITDAWYGPFEEMAEISKKI